MTTLGVLIHGPEVIDEGETGEALARLRKAGFEVEAALGGITGKTAVIDAGLQHTVDISKDMKPSEVLKYFLKRDLEFIVLVNHAKTETSGFMLGEGILRNFVDSGGATENISFVQLEYCSRIIIRWRVNAEDEALFKVITGLFTEFEVREPYKLESRCKKESNLVYRELKGVHPGEKIVVNGVIVGMATRGASDFPLELLAEIKLYSEYLPKAQELAFTQEQRYLHFLWDVLDKRPISVVVDFAIPFRRIIAKRLFKRCGNNFIAEENVRFNFGQNLELGNDVFMNRGVYLDTKGGLVLGDFVALTEGVEIYTHTHSESEHSRRSYGRVVINAFAKIYAHATILPGVTVGEQAIIAAKALVSKDVAPNMVVAGSPAKVIRERKTNGRSGAGLGHIWLYDAAFQK
ncbi:hypothetical protein C5S39_14740 [Candidatus Methanophagaceae archaeon]|nr:hypothetical protein C5S39_14740 [Methanophagales archaeon]